MINVIAQILIQIQTVETPSIPFGQEISLGAIVSAVGWYLYDENRKLKTKVDDVQSRHDVELKEVQSKYEAEKKELQVRYDALFKECRDREIALMEKNQNKSK